MKTIRKLLPLSAGLIAAGLMLSTQAQAEAYAVVTNNVRNGFIFGGVDTNNDGRPDLIDPTLVRFETPQSSSFTSATLNGTGNANSSAVTPPDADASNGTGAFPVRINEDVTGVYYNLFGPSTTRNYSAGDAIVNSEQDDTGTPIVARNMAESNVNGTATGAAQGNNASSTKLRIGDGCASAKCAVSFFFESDPYIRALLDAEAAIGSVARGTLSFSITLTKVGDVVPTFAWAPNGLVADGIFGGTELADAENLNLTREVLSAGGTALYSAPYGADGFGSYFAFTNYLDKPGEYTLSLAMSEKTDVERVPEPTMLSLLGLGLVGLAFGRRRKQA